MEEFNRVCSNPWCKGHFTYTELDFISVKKIDEKTGNIDEITKEHPIVCKKCRSFDSELSGGVEWKTKTYDDPIDFSPQQIKYRVTKYK